MVKEYPGRYPPSSLWASLSLWALGGVFGSQWQAKVYLGNPLSHVQQVFLTLQSDLIHCSQNSLILLLTAPSRDGYKCGEQISCTQVCENQWEFITPRITCITPAPLRPRVKGKTENGWMDILYNGMFHIPFYSILHKDEIWGTRQMMQPKSGVYTKVLLCLSRQTTLLQLINHSSYSEHQISLRYLKNGWHKPV